MHQNQWLAAIRELEEDGLEMTPVPSTFPQDLEKSEVAYQFLNHSEGVESQQGRWADGPSPDGKGQFTYVDRPPAYTEDEGQLNPIDPRVYGTPLAPVPPLAAE
jgi:Mn-containing catalase